MRREKNQYIFSAEMKKRQKGHGFRNTVLVLLPILIATFFLLNLTVSHRIRLDEIRLTVLNLPSDLEGYSILHISDLHGSRYGENQQAIEAALGTTRYSCVVMTGDMLGEDGDVEPLLELIALMPKDVPKFLITGDTDEPAVNPKAHNSLSVYAEWADRVQAAGVQILDLPALVTREKGRIWFVPEELYTLNTEDLKATYNRELEELNARATSLTADDAAKIRSLEYQLERLETLEKMKKDKEFTSTDIQIVLTHTPLTADYVADMVSWSDKDEYFSMRYASLILAGHYNGGQWRIPFAGAVYVPELGWFPDDSLVQGLSYLEGIPQYISPGMGSDPHYKQPGRLFNNVVITKIILTRKAN